MGTLIPIKCTNFDPYLMAMHVRTEGDKLVFSSAKFETFTNQGQLLKGVECHIYLYCFTFDDINLNRALVIIVLFATKYSNKKVCANDIRK